MRYFKAIMLQATAVCGLASAIQILAVAAAAAETYVCDISKVYTKHPYLPQRLSFSLVDYAPGVKLGNVEIEGVATVPVIPTVDFMTSKKLRLSWRGEGYELTGSLPPNHLRYRTWIGGVNDHWFRVSLNRKTRVFSADVGNRNHIRASGNGIGKCEILS